MTKTTEETKLKGGYITSKERMDLNSKAKKILEEVKNSKKEKSKVPYRVDKRTVILVSKKKHRQIMRDAKRGIFYEVQRY